MNAGTIFVLCLAAGFLLFVVYLAVLSKRQQRSEQDAAGKSPIADTGQRAKRRS